MIRLDRVSFSWQPPEPCLNGITAEIPGGKRCAIMGPNGSGKTTLLSLMLGYLKPDDGAVFIGKEMLPEIPRPEFIKKVGYVSQTVYLPFNLTVSEYVGLGRTAGRASRKGNAGETEKAAVDKALEKAGISRLKDRGVQELSGGEQQLASIARCLCQDPEILLLDEPVSHLDPLHRTQVFRLLKTLAGDGCTVVFTCHEPIHASMHSDSCLGIKKGETLFFGPTEEVLDSASLSTLYDTEFESVEYRGKRLPMELT